ncbi:MAG: LCP family protein, partial [Actinomycetes bacterium]
FRPQRVDLQSPGSGVPGTVFAVVGSDNRSFVPDGQRDRFGTTAQHPGERADVTMLVRVDPSGNARILEMPRDTLVVNGSGQLTRLTLELIPGPRQLANTICRALGIGVDHLIVVRFNTVKELVDRVGGVDVRSDEVTLDRYSDLLLNKGTNTLDGTRALAYVRARHMQVQRRGEWVDDPVRSAQRPERASEIARGLAARTTANPLRLASGAWGIWKVLGSVTLDSKMSPTDLQRLIEALASAPESSLLPTTHEERRIPVDRTNEATADAVRTFLGGAQRSPKCLGGALGRPG